MTSSLGQRPPTDADINRHHATLRQTHQSPSVVVCIGEEEFSRKLH